MHVLDLGCGVGDVSLLAGQLVGPSGSVLGIDRSQDAVETAERRAVAAGQCYWVRFASADFASFVPERKFDAIIGRLILMYLPEPAETLRRLAGFLRPGGIVAFQEMSMPTHEASPQHRSSHRCSAGSFGPSREPVLRPTWAESCFRPISLPACPSRR
ncbi:class I SAM-dependent methyltransferase [Mesorhizobium sp. IMUNJ 23033]|uniref:class I SAM-dependent methyltransferase n=1 Tax=Mesorhizobium sp. IMUNJ 23033 TaxID=3378039 RepID=UPI00384CE1C5